MQIERRTADDLQDVGGGRLLLKRFLKVARLCLHFVEQAHVLDCDHRLVCEGGHEIDLALRKRDRLGAPERKRADYFAVAHQRHAEHRPDVADARLLLFCIFWVRPGVDDLDCPVFQRDTPYQRSTTRRNFRRSLVVEIRGVDIHTAGGIMVEISVAAENLAISRIAQAQRRRD